MADTTKMFVHVKKGSTLNLTDVKLGGKYYDSIVFDENTGAIYARGGVFGSVEEATKAIAELKYFNKVAGNTGDLGGAATPGSILNIKGKANDYVETVVSSEGVTIQATSKLTSEIADAKSAGTAASSALEEYKEENDEAVKAAKAQADKGVLDAAAALAEAQKKVASVGSGSQGIDIKGTATAPTVALKLDNSGNVKFTEGANGLKAEVTIESVEVPITNVSSGSNAIGVDVASKNAAVSLKTDNSGNVQFSLTESGLKGLVTFPVTGVKSGDKVLALSGTELTSTLKLKYDSSSKKLQLLGIDDAVIHEIDATAFVKDGMISNIEYDQDTHELSITFNTDAGDVTIDNIDLSDLVDIYEEGMGIQLTDGEQGKKINVQKDNTSEDFLSVSASGVKVSGIQNAINTAKGEAITAALALKVNGQAFGTAGEATVAGKDIKLTGYTGEGSVTATDTVNSAIAKLESSIDAAVAGSVTSVDGITGAVELDKETASTVGHVKFSKSGQKITAVAENVASAELGTKADSALQSITINEGTYVKVAKSGTATAPIFTITDTSIESLFAWEEI